MTDTSNTTEKPVPTKGRLLGVDFGTKRIGFAISSPDQKYSSPLVTCYRQSEKVDGKFIKNLVEENDIVGMVIGLPVHMSGDEGGVAAQVRLFGTWLNELTELTVNYWDERFTSGTAEGMLYAAEMNAKQRKAKIDKLAAHLILQSFLDADDRTLKPQAMPKKEN